jgi:SWI/SNF-related matrix-associated actin-dependent regulator 1 of chromatin subfamily A
MSQITVTHNTAKGLYEIRFRYDPATIAVVKALKCRWSPEGKFWWTKDPEVAKVLQRGAGAAVEAVNAEREATHAREAQAIADSRAVEADIVIPLSARCKARGMDFLPYQKAGIAYALGRSQVLIADEMGLGKTMQALGIINADETIRNALIIVPASLKANWAREARLWLSRPLRVEIVNGGAKPTGGVCIINYEMVRKLRPWIDSIAWDILIADEAHYLKNLKADRTVAVLGRKHKEEAQRRPPIAARRRVLMTGTPILNRPIELWPFVQALDPQGLGRNWKDFAVTYCAGHMKRTPGPYGRMVWDTLGASSLPELQARLRSSIMVRRLKSEVLTELPAKRRQIVLLRAESAAEKAAIAHEHTATDATLGALREAVERLSEDEASQAYKDAVEALSAAYSVSFEQMSAARHEVAMAKLDQCVAHVKDALESVDKLVVFAHHHDVIDGLVAALKDVGVARADGRDSNEVRDAAVQRFQSDPSLKVIVCSISAMGVGHTLTAASTVIFCELSYVPGLVQQAEDRCHRIGQRDHVLVQHLILDGSLDARMTEILVSKMDVIALAIDHAEHLASPELLAQPKAPEPPRDPRQPAPDDLTDDQIAAVHLAIQMLAGVCDGAQNLDGQGFNRFDARYGHALAACDSLTQAQAKAGRRLVWKYQRQYGPALFARIKGAPKT